jgi:hypothetical protein
MHANERGRLTGINGVESVLTLYPDRIGPRIKKNVIKMFENAHITGGWASQSRQVAEALAQKFNLNILQTRWCGITLYGQPEPDVRDQLISLIQADISAWMLENTHSHHNWYRDQAKATIENLQSGVAKYVDFRSKEYAKQAVTLINKNLPDAHRKRNQHVIDLLNGSEPIHLTTIRS